MKACMFRNQKVTSGLSQSIGAGWWQKPTEYIPKLTISNKNIALRLPLSIIYYSRNEIILATVISNFKVSELAITFHNGNDFTYKSIIFYVIINDFFNSSNFLLILLMDHNIDGLLLKLCQIHKSYK